MTREQLENIRALKVEVYYLQQQIKELQKMCVGGEVLCQLQCKLIEKFEVLYNEQLKIEEWLDSISDPEIRVILRLRYLERLSQQKVADLLMCDRRTVLRKEQRFWNGLNIIKQP